MEHLFTNSRGQDVFHLCLTPPYSLGSPPFAGADFLVLIINNDDAISPDDQYALSLALVRVADMRSALATIARRGTTRSITQT